MLYVCFCKQKTAYEMRISDWSSDVCSSDLFKAPVGRVQTPTLAIVNEREERIRKFVSRDYWEVHATFVAAAGFYTGRWFDRSEERRVGKSVSVRVDLGGRRIIQKKNTKQKKDRNTLS